MRILVIEDDSTLGNALQEFLTQQGYAVDWLQDGGQAVETADGLDITPRPLHGARLETYHDHRMATFAAILGLRVPGVDVVDVATTAKTLPDFPGMWAAMLATADGRR